MCKIPPPMPTWRHHISKRGFPQIKLGSIFRIDTRRGSGLAVAWKVAVV